ncbi:MAG: DUF4282 domain-containing protein [Alphaproteobacteria bacterium]|nr:DUF4282 domain-containing protein [Alphaproteobacteria bacterium]
MDKFSLGDLFQFEKMVAPVVLKIVYWLGLVGIGIYLLIAIAGGVTMLNRNAAIGLGTILLALVGAVFGVLLWRILIEVYMILFGIHERLGEVRDMMRSEKEPPAN